MQASRLSQGAPLPQDAPAAPGAAAAQSNETAIAVAQALDAEPPTLCLQLDSTTQPELLPLQDPTALVSHPGAVHQRSSRLAASRSACGVRAGAALQNVQAQPCKPGSSSTDSLEDNASIFLQKCLTFSLLAMLGTGAL